MNARLLLPLRSTLSFSVALGCAGSAALMSVAVGAEQHAAEARSHGTTLLIAAIDPEPGRRVRAAVALADQLSHDPRWSVRRIPPGEVRRIMDPADAGPWLPIPEIVTVASTSPPELRGLATGLSRRSDLIVRSVPAQDTPRPLLHGSGPLALLLALSGSGWTARRHVRRRAALLLLLRRLGTRSGRLVAEVLGPLLLSGVIGTGLGAAIGLDLLEMLPGTGTGAGPAVAASLVVPAALAGGLGSLRRLMAGRP